MTWTWDETSIDTDLAKVRQTIGDTNTKDKLLTDEQIEWRLSQYSDSVPAASIQCVRDIIAKLSRDFDRNVAGFSGSRSQKINHFKILLDELKEESGLLAEAFVGGLSEDTEQSFDEDDDYKALSLRIGMDDKAT